MPNPGDLIMIDESSDEAISLPRRVGFARFIDSEDPGRIVYNECWNPHDGEVGFVVAQPGRGTFLLTHRALGWILIRVRREGLRVISNVGGCGL